MNYQHMLGLKHKRHFIIANHYPLLEEKNRLYKRMWFMSRAIEHVPSKITYEELEGLSHCYVEVTCNGTQYDKAIMKRISDICD